MLLVASIAAGLACVRAAPMGLWLLATIVAFGVLLGSSERVRSGVGWGVLAIPLAHLALVVSLWSLAYFQLGRPPRPSQDDPASLGPVMRVGHIVEQLSLMPLVLCPPLAIANLAVTLLSPPVGLRQRRRSPLLSLAAILAWIGVLSVYRLNPHQIGAWLAD